MLRATLQLRVQRFQVAVVGAGPGGCYVAHHLLKQRTDVHIDIFESLPVPYGLSRYGVAPDHPEVKNVEKTFDKFFVDRPKDVNLLANVAIGDKGVPIKLLQEHYHAVVLAYGASSNRLLGVPGEGLNNVLPAKRFVEYYNTVPAPAADPHLCPVALHDVRRVVIIGNGNVALDCARVLGLGYKHFCKTDMNCFAVQALMNSSVEEVIVVGRRGVEHSAFTTKEFRELATTSNHCAVEVEEFDLDAAVESSKNVRGKKRQLELMHQYCPNSKQKQAEKEAAGPEKPTPKYPADSPNDMRDSFSIFKTGVVDPKYARAPEHFKGPDQTVTRMHNPHQARRKVYFTYNLTPKEVTPNPLDKKKCGGMVFTDREGREVLIPCDAVLTSIGYKSVAMRGVPFDAKSATIPNDHGRVLSAVEGDVAAEAAMPEGAAAPNPARLYTAGWAKTGPRGVILTTMQSAAETAHTISADFDAAKALRASQEAKAKGAEGGVIEEGDVSAAAASVLAASGEGKYGLIDHLVQTQAEPVSYAQVKKIWHAERRRGMDLGKPAEKVPSVSDMVDMVGTGKLMARRAKDRFLGNAPARPPGLELMEDWLDPETEMMDLSDPERKTPELNVRL